jgi:hypothetical protein
MRVALPLSLPDQHVAHRKTIVIPRLVAFEIRVLVQLRHFVNQRERSQFTLRPLFADHEVPYGPICFHLIEQCKSGFPKSSPLPVEP